MIRLDIDSASRTGLVRDNNEDMILVGDKMIRNDSYQTNVSLDNKGMYIVALADGMGGHNAGEKASEIVLASLKKMFSLKWKYMDASDFNEAAYMWLDHINNNITSLSKRDVHLVGMGTTLVGFIVNYSDCYWLNCGDSRIYLYRKGELKQLSTDHSLSNLMGEKTRTGIIVNCIGGGCTSSYIDMVEFRHLILPGDEYILCSDGLSDMLTDEQIQSQLIQGASAEQLCKEAEVAGGADNVSVSIIKVLNI